MGSRAIMHCIALLLWNNDFISLCVTLQYINVGSCHPSSRGNVTHDRSMANGKGNVHLTRSRFCSRFQPLLILYDEQLHRNPSLRQQSPDQLDVRCADCAGQCTLCCSPIKRRTKGLQQRSVKSIPFFASFGASLLGHILEWIRPDRVLNLRC